MKVSQIILALAFGIALVGCRGDIYIQPSTSTEVESPRITGVDGFYLINEGNMGSNKATLDYFDETINNVIEYILSSK